MTAYCKAMREHQGELVAGNSACPGSFHVSSGAQAARHETGLHLPGFWREGPWAASVCLALFAASKMGPGRQQSLLGEESFCRSQLRGIRYIKPGFERRERNHISEAKAAHRAGEEDSAGYEAIAEPERAEEGGVEEVFGEQLLSSLMMVVLVGAELQGKEAAVNSWKEFAEFSSLLCARVCSPVGKLDVNCLQVDPDLENKAWSGPEPWLTGR
ncbi:hypothetical protein P7K49_012683 [Saguinus oedipus]|uniref:Uncharacterized protein n=1 Tax=Saguinus oedipus TaxID=9490 RepID=A0ABQ9VDV2_SAGOE|nr:hypothetical protein P7K49_012683 [Saguinus oedipus]